ncbi:MAG: heparinase II/III domain-containing protein [Candidatus Latescibacterota bacterium]
MKVPFLFFLLLLLTTSTHAQTTPSTLSASLPSPLTHPYLLFSSSEKPALLARIQTDPDCRDIFVRLISESNRLLYTPVDPIPPQPKERGPQLFDNTGDDGFMAMYYAYRTAAYNLAFVYQMTRERRYAEKAFEFAREVCDMPTWVFRACQFPYVYDRVWPWNVSDDQVMFTYEIVSSDTAAMLAVAYDWLYPALSREQRDWIRSGLLGHAITRVRGNWDFHWWATAYRCNWCSWCCNGLGLAALAMLTENPELVDMVAESYNRIWRTFDETGPDGDWAEGGSYWSHTFNKPLVFGAALSRLTGGKYNLYRHPKLLDNPVNFPLWLLVPPNRRINFADASDTGLLGSRQLMNKIVLETGNPEAAWLLANRYGRPSDILDIIWPNAAKQDASTGSAPVPAPGLSEPRPLAELVEASPSALPVTEPVEVTPSLPTQASKLFRTTGIAILRSDFTDPEKVTVACKAGRNDDPHHGHYDVGQFMVYWRGEAFIRDLGSGQYDILYFSTKRYDTPHASSAGHNLIFVNGETQIPGKLKDQPINPAIGGEILEFRPGETRDYVRMDNINAYVRERLKGWRRHIILEKPVITVVLDEVSCAPGAEIEARFHSEGAQSAKEDYTLITGKSGKMALIPVTENAFAFRPGRHAYMPVFKQSTFEWIPYMGTTVTATEEKTVLAHVILPVEDDAEARSIVASVRRSLDSAGTLTLAFEKTSKKYRYIFEKSPDGLALR